MKCFVFVFLFVAVGSVTGQVTNINSRWVVEPEYDGIYYINDSIFLFNRDGVCGVARISGEVVSTFNKVVSATSWPLLVQVGNGLVFAEVSTISPQTSADRWGDKSLKCCIIDLNNKTVRDIKEIPVHNGDGGRRFAALVDGGYVYRPVTTSEGTYIYQVDPQAATAVRGAKVSTTFVGGFFRLD